MAADPELGTAFYKKHFSLLVLEQYLMMNGFTTRKVYLSRIMISVCQLLQMPKEIYSKAELIQNLHRMVLFSARYQNPSRIIRDEQGWAKWLSFPSTLARMVSN